MGHAIPHGSAVYIRYLDHVLFRNTPEALDQPAERETIGWLTQENKELICIQHDRTIENLQQANGTASGLVLLKSCVLEIRALPLQNISSWPLISRNDITRNAEYALQNAKRKTQPE
ncbi:MAG: hypothetical protein OEZ35_00010 [Candidatus Bathyarchaeota archaeon]|nr:hypothetical protein [Candidatus Bathyarchaeota archaeon]